jgi:hypothetical protein
MLQVTLAKVDDPEEYELMEWLQAHPGDWDKVPERLRPWKSIVSSKGFVKFEDMITGHTLSDLGRITLLKYQREQQAKAQQTKELKPAGGESMLNAPFVQEILSSLEPERERVAQEEEARRLQQEQRRRRENTLYELLTAITYCEPGTFDQKSQHWLNRETLYVALVERFIDLEKFLRKEGLLGRLDRLPADSKAAQFLRSFILKCAETSAADAGAVLERLDGRDQFASELNRWIRRLREINLPDQWPVAAEALADNCDDVSELPAAQSKEDGAPPCHSAPCDHPEPAGEESEDKQCIDAAVRKIRETFEQRPELRGAKRNKVIEEARVRREDGLAALRRLEEAGEYTGGSRKRKK